MADNKLYDIKTGKLIKTNERQKRGQDAKRWKYLMGMIQRGEATIMMGGAPIVGDLLKSTIDYIDDQIIEEQKNKKRDYVRRYRSNK